MFATAVDRAPITKQFPVPEDLDQFIRNPGCPRAAEAADVDHPAGSDNNKKDLTVLQQHIEFFDLNKDGIIYPYETLMGFWKIGFNILFCFLAMLIIHGGFAYMSQDSWIPNPLFPIYIKNIHRCMHGSDSGTYDNEGRYIPQKFEELFSKFDKGDKKGLSFRDLISLNREFRNVFDFFGYFANIFEWGTLYLLCKDENGLVSKEKIRRVYDGTLFYMIDADFKQQKENRRLSKEAANQSKIKGI
ncbi:Caleosin related protein-domain-containing protein [Phlyctochytrium arcticum]|nr:Caleosin related protein-domain-containing protein [Phlyctochytrium arcticum]